MNPRHVTAVLLLASGALLTMAIGPDSELPARAHVSVLIDGPEGSIWSGDVEASPGSAFAALLAASEAGNFSVHWSGPPGARFVHAIAGMGAGEGGWCVQVDGADSPVSTDRFPVIDGQSVRWYWTASQCARF